MHGSIQLVVANESDRLRHADAANARARRSGRTRGIARTLFTRVVAAHGIPTRAAPGTDTRSLGHPSPAPLRGR